MALKDEETLINIKGTDYVIEGYKSKDVKEAVNDFKIILKFYQTKRLSNAMYYCETFKEKYDINLLDDTVEDCYKKVFGDFEK